MTRSRERTPPGELGLTGGNPRRANTDGHPGRRTCRRPGAHAGAVPIPAHAEILQRKEIQRGGNGMYSSSSPGTTAKRPSRQSALA